MTNLGDGHGGCGDGGGLADHEADAQLGEELLVLLLLGPLVSAGELNHLGSLWVLGLEYERWKSCDLVSAMSFGKLRLPSQSLALYVSISPQTREVHVDVITGHSHRFLASFLQLHGMHFLATSQFGER